MENIQGFNDAIIQVVCEMNTANENDLPELLTELKKFITFELTANHHLQNDTLMMLVSTLTNLGQRVADPTKLEILNELQQDLNYYTCGQVYS